MKRYIDSLKKHGAPFFLPSRVAVISLFAFLPWGLPITPLLSQGAVHVIEGEIFGAGKFSFKVTFLKGEDPFDPRPEKNIINVTKAPQPKLKIRIEAISLPNKYLIRICQECVRPTRYGYSKTVVNKQYLAQGDITEIEYIFNRKYLANKDENKLIYSIKAVKESKKTKGILIKRTRDKNFRDEITVESPEYFIKTELTKEEKITEAKKILDLIENNKNNPFAKTAHCDDFLKKYGSSPDIPDELKNQVNEKCNSASNDPITDKIKTLENELATLANQVDRLSQDLEKYTIIENYFKDNPVDQLIIDLADQRESRLTLEYLYSELVVNSPEEEVQRLCQKYYAKFPAGIYHKKVENRCSPAKAADEGPKPGKPAGNKGGSGKNAKPDAQDVKFSVVQSGDRREWPEEVVIEYRCIGHEDKKPEVSSNPKGVDVKEWKEEETILVIGLPPGFRGTIFFSIPETGKKVSIPINLGIPQLKAGIAISAADGSIAVDISGGEPPYSVSFLEGAYEINMYEIEIGNNKSVTIPKEDYEDQLPSGKYTVQVLDKTRNTSDLARSGKQELIHKRSGVPLWIVVPISAIVLSFFLLLGYQRIKKSYKVSEEFKRKVEIAQRGNPETQRTDHFGDPKKRIFLGKRVGADGDEKAREPAATGIQNGAFPTEPHPEILSLTREVPQGILLDDGRRYRLIPLQELWDQSIVSEIYIHERCAARIHNFVFKDNKDLLSLQQNAIPEIGGWLLGRQVFDQASKKYLVSFERFIDITPESQSDTQITFGTNAWVKLDQQIDAYRSERLELVGWFHTHPGWGVFLSREDINTHETIFKKPFQIAMEMDSLKETHEVGFFSRQPNLKLNTQPGKKNRFFRWEDFKEWLKEA